MYDVAIVGAGLSGLALAQLLEAQGRTVALVEARERIGGRIETTIDPSSGLAIDLGASWFWPAHQPLLAELVQRLDLQPFAQFDEGAHLSLEDPTQGARSRTLPGLHQGAQRLPGGMGDVVAALAARLSRSELYLGCTVESVTDEGDHVRLETRSKDTGAVLLARRCVLAMPPRLVATLTFGPPLSGEIVAALHQTPTWMATQAKAAVTCPSPDWRSRGLSGSAFVTHSQATLGETWDACGPSGAPAGLAGFLALSPDQRRTFAPGLPMLIANQFAQLFGETEWGAAHWRDWSAEPWTCSAEDFAEGPRDGQPPAPPELRQGLWAGRLHFAGSETAARDPGRMEGALDAARRVAGAIRDADNRAQALAEPARVAAVTRFAQWFEQQGPTAFGHYRAAMARAMMRQDRDQLTQKALLGAVEATLDAASLQLAELAPIVAGPSDSLGRALLLPALQAPFKPFLDALLAEVWTFNAASCALSNFPDEHRPPPDYRNAMLRDIAAAWIAFSRSANQLLVETALPPGSIARGEA